MSTFEVEIPMNITAIREEVVPVKYLGNEIGSCTIQAIGFEITGSFQLERAIDFEQYELNYHFISGGLQTIIVTDTIENNFKDESTKE